MTKTTFTGYVPSLKAKHEATVTEGKAMASKGGSIRYTIQGEYDGRKTFPKTVTKADFEGLYGFDAKEAEAVIISGKMPRNKEEDRIHIKDVMEEDGFIPKKIIEVHDVQKIPSVEAGIPLGKNYSNHHKFADTVGSPSPASVETCDFMQSHSPNNMVEKDDGSWKCQGCGEITETFSATTERVIITLGDDPEDDEDEEEIEEETEDEDEEEEDAGSDEKEEDSDSDEEKDEKVEDEDEEQEEEDSEEEDDEDEDEDEEEFEAVSVEVEREQKEEEPEDEDEDGLLTPMNVALGLGAVALGVAVFGAEGEYPQEFLDEFYDFDSNPTADTQDEETVAIAYQAWLHNKEGVCGCGIDCVCDCGCAESGVCNCGESCPCDCGCGVESFGTDSLVEEPDWIPDGDGRALGQQNLDINLSPLHAEQNEYHTSNVFYADEDVQKMTSSEFVPFDQITSEIQQEWDETTAPIAADYEPLDEPTNANFSADTSDIALSQEEIEEIERGMDIDLSSFKQRIANGASAKNVIETYRIRGRHNRKELMDYEKRLYETETVGSPSPTFNEGITGQDGPSAEPTNADFSAEGGLSKNAQYAIGLAALGVGIALWNGDWVSKMFDRFKR